jgi:hypothetical protein
MAELDPIVEARPAIEAQPGGVATPLASSRGVMLYKVMGKTFAILEDARVTCVIPKCDPHGSARPGAGRRLRMRKTNGTQMMLMSAMASVASA